MLATDASLPSSGLEPASVWLGSWAGWEPCWAELGTAGRLLRCEALAGRTFTKSRPCSVSRALAECGSTEHGSWMLCSTGTCAYKRNQLCSDKVLRCEASAGRTFMNSRLCSVSSALAECRSLVHGSWLLCSTGTCAQEDLEQNDFEFYGQSWAQLAGCCAAKHRPGGP